MLQECKISGSAGFTKLSQYKGGQYTIPLTSISIGYEP
jgi:hypothetical protein